MQKDSGSRPSIIVLTSTFPRWINDPEPAFVFELSRRLTSDFDITVLSPRAPGSRKNETMADVRVIRFPYFFQRWEKLATYGGGILNRLKSNPLNYFLVPFFLTGQLIALIRLMRREHFDVIHAHWLIPQGFVAVIGRILTQQKQIPLLCTSHGGDLFTLRGAILNRTKRWIMDHSQLLTVVSCAMKKYAVNMGIAPEKVKVISMGVDLKHRHTPNNKTERDPNCLLFVGRLVEKKGAAILLQAMPDVLKQNPDARLIVAGSGPLEAGLRNLARSLNISDSVEFLGMMPQSHLPALYRQAAMAVFPFLVDRSGDQEGFGLVQVEAMGCGCPVIAGDLPAIHDTIVHQENGLLVPPGDPKSLARAIVMLLGDPALRDRLSAEGRKRMVERFEWEIVAGKYAKLYKKMSIHAE